MRNWNGPLNKVDDYVYEIPRDYKPGMRTDGRIYLNDALKELVMKDNAPEQVANVATLPGIIGPSMAMPDIHWGYGFPIGGVAAMDIDGGVISPGGVGYDINCGVRLLRTDLSVSDVRDKLRALVDAMFENVPSGLGSKGRVRVSRSELQRVLEEGAPWAVENGYGWDADPEMLEESGCMKGADASKVSERAIKRGMPQLGSLGAGNHFLEIQRVAEIFDEDKAKVMGITGPDQVVVMIHTGSRGCGYQICDDQIAALSRHFRRDGKVWRSDKFGIELPDPQLVCAPIGTKEADTYLAAMKAAANYAWTNRQLITHWVRESFEGVLGTKADELGMDIVYDVAHNIAKEEEHDIDGSRRKVIVHRKGATRSFGPDSPGLPGKYSSTGQPVLIPGDMGTTSYVLAGTEKAMTESAGSACHGAGRLMSRKAAVRKFHPDQLLRELGDRGIYVRAASKMVLAEEAPGSYKDVSQVVNTVHGAGLATRVARMEPLGVVKG